MQKRNSFTLVEILVVISILAILIAMLLPALIKAKSKSREVSCKSLMKQYAFATSLYTDDNSGYFPDIRRCLKPECGFFLYICGGKSFVDEKLTRCPSDGSTAMLGRLGYFEDGGKVAGVSIGGTVNLSDSASPITGGTAAFWQTQFMQVNCNPARRIQWTDYQNQAGGAIDGPVMSIGKAGNMEYNLQATLKEYVFRHNGRANAAYADCHVGSAWIEYSTQNDGHDLAAGVKWYFPGNTKYPYGPRQGNFPYGDNYGVSYE